MRKRLFILGLLLIGIFLFIWINNKWIVVSEYTINSSDMPAAFDGVRIVHLSDLQRTSFGKKQLPVLEKVAAAEPDAIFITGDLVDADRFKLEPVLTLLNGLSEISDVYFVTGNQEISKDRAEEVLSALKRTEITILENEKAKWNREGETVYIAGIHDPLMDISTYDPLIDVNFRNQEIEYSKRARDYTRESLEEVPFTDDFTFLLTHRPEMIEEYAETPADLVFAGHAHGGQIRIPGIGGLFAPGQGFFPELTEGVHEFGDIRLVITRGLGNSSFPLRINNRPEVTVVTLEHEEVTGLNK
ncbi:metallophosphoesterase [Planococcus lenghuensis]|uniref:Calcineurin-like phosphoesterase domain-containing protein n=1 Tax=Planococcus lenghuensis TaxID=2213202 RepID=A0A1Q2L4D3_9BACL|nr:metallophosphoesterase [Planococcus lenghuensis]AQQ55310.1 hypothetical protein B0X71_19235 [Planococcus lenghuensis]